VDTCQPLDLSEENTFIRRRGKGPRTISLSCPRCGYKQYDVTPTSRRGCELIVDCAQCGFEGQVQEVRTG